MDANAGRSVEDQLATVQGRIEEHRDDVAGTIEALSYKTDIGARGSEALAEAGRSAKSAAERGAEDVAIKAIDTTARASETMADGAEAAKRYVRRFGPQSRSIAIFVGSVSVIGLFVTIRRTRKG